MFYAVLGVCSNVWCFLLRGLENIALEGDRVMACTYVRRLKIEDVAGWLTTVGMHKFVLYNYFTGIELNARYQSFSLCSTISIHSAGRPASTLPASRIAELVDRNISLNAAQSARSLRLPLPGRG